MGVLIFWKFGEALPRLRRIVWLQCLNMILASGVLSVTSGFMFPSSYFVVYTQASNFVSLASPPSFFLWPLGYLGHRTTSAIFCPIKGFRFGAVLLIPGCLFGHTSSAQKFVPVTSVHRLGANMTCNLPGQIVFKHALCREECRWTGCLVLVQAASARTLLIFQS